MASPSGCGTWPFDLGRWQRRTVSAQVEIKIDRGKWLLQLQGRQLRRVLDARDGWHQACTCGKGEVVPQVMVAIDIDLRRQLAVARRTDEEMDVRRTLAVPAQQIEQ